MTARLRPLWIAALIVGRLTLLLWDGWRLWLFALAHAYTGTALSPNDGGRIAGVIGGADGPTAIVYRTSPPALWSIPAIAVLLIFLALAMLERATTPRAATPGRPGRPT